MSAHVPRREDEFAAWIKRHRDEHGSRADHDAAWSVLDDLLDSYRLLADTGTSLAGGEELPARPYDPALRIIDAQSEASQPFGSSTIALLRRDLGLDHDYRFEIDTPGGGTMTYHRQATADHVAREIGRFKSEADD